LKTRTSEETCMTLSRRALSVAALAAASFSTASAQAPATAKPGAENAGAARPAAASAAPLTEKNVSMHMALAIIEGALEQCAKDGYKVSVVILSNDGVVRASLRGDGTA